MTDRNVLPSSANNPQAAPRKKLNILLNPVGSAGDVHPLAGLGAALKARGHDVTFITNDYFQPLAEGLGLTFIPMGTRAEFEAVLHHPDAWHPRKALDLIFRTVIEKTLTQTVETVQRLNQPGRTVVVGTSLALGTRVAQDWLKIPTVSVHLAPSIFRSSYVVPRFSGLGFMRVLPSFARNWMWRVIDALVVDRALAGPLNEFRAKLGLPRVKRFMHDWWHSPLRVIGLFPPWFGPPQPDWPAQTVLTGFPMFDERELHGLAPEVEAFLAQGDKPLVFTPGSAMLQGEKFFAAAAAACAKLGRRGILLTRFPEQIPHELPAGVRHFSYVPLSALLPRAAAMVYHGGIGTCAQALAAGVPHLITPMAHDQHDNAARIRRLGVGAELEMSRVTAASLSRALGSLLSDRKMPGRCHELAQRMAQERPIEKTCALIEEAAS